MQRLEGLLRKAVQDYEMIAPGDRGCVGVSGGKDSVALTVALGHLRRYLGVPFEVMAVTGHCTLPRRNLAATKWRWGTTWMMPWRLFT